MKKIRLPNRYGAPVHLERAGRSVFRLCGDFGYLGVTRDNDEIKAVDPAGGPFIAVGGKVAGMEVESIHDDGGCFYIHVTGTPSFHDILHQTNVENVLSSLESHYKSSENELDGYRILMKELLGKKPAFSEYQISITHVSADDEEYENVFGVIPGNEQSYGMESIPAEEWLGMHLTEDTLKNYSAEDIIAHCLWEMTFFGFSDAEILGKKEELMDSCNNDEEHYTYEDGNPIPEDL